MPYQLISSHLHLRGAAAGPEGDDGRGWQPYTDFLVASVLLALPWGGPELAEAAPEKLQARGLGG